MNYKIDERFRWQSRLVLGYCRSGHNSSSGYAAVQQLTFNTDHYRFTAQVVLFHVKDWANRIYLYEPGFYYSFNFPVYYGTGHKTTILFDLKPAKGFGVAVKLSGTGNKGKQSWESGIQIRIKL